MGVLKDLGIKMPPPTARSLAKWTERTRQIPLPLWGLLFFGVGLDAAL
jgi:hypothetical protein